MIKKVAVAAVAVILMLVVLSPVPLKADSGLAVIDSWAETDFPYSISFNIEAESGFVITDIRLHYRVERDSFAVVTSEVDIEFVEGTSVTAGWIWDMVKSGGLPPGTVIEYRWTLTDAGENQIETDKYQVQFNDERYSWRSLNEGNITLYWYDGDDSFARRLMEASQQAMVSLEADTGARLERAVAIYIYASYQELREAMVFPQEWTGGVAYTTYGTVAVGINSGNLDWGKRAIVHELTHLVTHQMTFNPYNSLPVWLDEGLSMYAEGEMEPVFESCLKQAVMDNALIPVRSLASPFSACPAKSYLSYAQSLSLVEFLIDSYGQQKMFELLGTFKQGSGYDEALEAVYGFDMDGLDALWQDYIAIEYGVEAEPALSPVPASSFLVAAILTTLGLVVAVKLKGWAL